MRNALLTLAMLMTTSGAAAADDLMSIYQDLHRHPELSFKETRSAGILAAQAKAAGFAVTSGVGQTGVVAVLVNGPGPVLLIRTDMDALPVPEATGLSYASQTAGQMHACGHDIHMTSWIAVARAMSASRAKWSGTLVMIGQPAEEISGGAAAMLKDGLYTRFPRPTNVLAFHDSAALPVGRVAVNDGYMMANIDSVDIVVRGIGSHGAAPNLGIDPIVLGARIVGALQTLVSREVTPGSPAVVTVGTFNAGTKRNIIPDEAKLQLTVRSYDPATRKLLLAGIQRIAKGEAEAAGVPGDRLPAVTFAESSEAVLNTPGQTPKVRAAIAAALGADAVVPLPASMVSEDFSSYSLGQKDIESTMFWVGAQPQSVWSAAGGDIRKLPGLHSAKFAPDPAPTIATAVEAMTAAAMGLLAKR